MLTHMGTRTIRTNRLTLRRILPEDAGMVYVWMSDPEVCRYERWRPHRDAGYTEGYIKAVFRYESDMTYEWGMELAGVLVGAVSVVNVSDHDEKATIGYVVARKYWGNGYATEGARAVLEYMFDDIGVNRLEASCAVVNAASGRVLEKIGMAQEGLARDYYNSNSGLLDSRLFGLTRDAYLAGRTPR